MTLSLPIAPTHLHSLQCCLPHYTSMARLITSHFSFLSLPSSHCTIHSSHVFQEWVRFILISIVDVCELEFLVFVHICIYFCIYLYLFPYICVYVWLFYSLFYRYIIVMNMPPLFIIIKEIRV